MRYNTWLVCFCLSLFSTSFVFSQHGHEAHVAATNNRDPQPILSQALRLRQALDYLGSSLSATDASALTRLSQHLLNAQTVDSIAMILDPYCLAVVNINPEARVRVERGRAGARLTQGGWTSFLVKVQNQAGVTARLNVRSSHSVLPFHVSDNNPVVTQGNLISESEAAQRFLDLQLYAEKPLSPELSGLPLEYAVLQIYSKQAGIREADLAFNIGAGTEDV